MIVNHNISASRAHSDFISNTHKLEDSFRVLASGERINKAGDDPAGLAVSEKMRAQIQGLTQALRNIQDGVSFVQTAEGYLEENSNIVQRMRELSVQASNGTYTAEDRAQITVEFDEMVRELNRIHEDAKFNTQRIFDGYSLGVNSFGRSTSSDGVGDTSGDLKENISLSRNINFNSIDGNRGLNGLVIQSGSNTDERMFMEIGTLNSYTIGLTGEPNKKYSDLSEIDNNNLAYREFSFFEALEKPIEESLYLESSIRDSAYAITSGEPLGISYLSALEGNRLDISSSEKATETIAVLDVALNKIIKERTNLGSFQNRLETAVRGVSLAKENITDSESRIRDADIAGEYVALTRNAILSHAGSVVLAQAKKIGGFVLKLIN